MEKYNENTKMETKLWDILDSMEIEDDIEHVKTLFEQWLELCVTEKMKDVLIIAKDKQRNALKVYLIL